MDFATRAYNHGFPFDPIIRSMLDTDFYKFLMQQFIWERYPNEQVTWKLSNRTRHTLLCDRSIWPSCASSSAMFARSASPRPRSSS